jgi:hypothetical protein
MGTQKKDTELQRQRGSEKLHGDPLDPGSRPNEGQDTSVEDEQDEVASGSDSNLDKQKQ